MDIIAKPSVLREQIQTWRQEGKRIGFVPTMGNLHEGHLELVRRAQQYADVVVVSIFVNPMQFDRAEDLDNYPRTLEQDCQMLQALHTDLVFTPASEVIYPRGTEQQTFVEVPGLSDVLEGACRPGHFRGVATVVNKLFNLVQPDIACFGEKDFQQLTIIQQMVTDLAMDIDVIGVPTVRAEDGLALSSRNTRLTPQEREQAPHLARVMREMAACLQRGERDCQKLIDWGQQVLIQNGFKTDQLFICDTQTLQHITENTTEAVVLMSGFLGAARLIDNLVVKL